MRGTLLRQRSSHGGRGSVRAAGPIQKRSGRLIGPLLLGAVACATGAAPDPATLPLGPASPGPTALSRTAAAWVDSTLASLDLRARVAQLVSVWMTGGYAPRSSEEFRRVAGLVEDHGIGGVTISVGLPDSYVSKLNALQEIARLPLLVTSDFESGPGYRLGGIYALPTMLEMGGATEFPPAMAFGAIGDERYAYRLGRITAEEARALGVHLNFAPVLDVNNNPANPIINVRSFGEDPRLVARLGAAFIRGARDGGLMSTAKHFPGHGDTRTDSHLELPAIGADRLRLDSLELVPFRRAIEAGVDAIMTAHVAAPRILGPGAPPATLDPYFMTRLLRGELGFEGLILTDALDMGAIVRGYGRGEAAVRALEAGADVLLMPPDPVEAIEAVVEAVREGRLSEDRVAASVRRFLTLKARAGLHLGRRVEPRSVAEVVGSADHAAFADTAAGRSITLVRDLEGRIPLDTTRLGRLFSLVFAGETDLAAGRAFDRRLAGAGAEVATVRTSFSTPPVVFDSLAERAASADLVVVSVYVAPRSGGGSLDVPEALGRFADRAAEGGTPVILVSFGSPYLVASFPDVSAYLLAWGGGAVSQRAAVDALLGRRPTTGRLPITLPPYHRRGEGLRRPVRTTVPMTRGEEMSPASAGLDSAALARVDRLLLTAVADSVTPGAALAVGRAGRVVRMRGYGRLDWAEGSPPVTDSTLYDLASLTKVVGTTTALMLLVEEETVRLDDPVGDHLPEWDRAWRSEVTVRHLLLHRGGLPPFRPFWTERRGRGEYREAIGVLEPVYGPGERTLYSDLGFITLGFLAEAASGEPLDAYLERRLFGPLGMTDTGFNPDSSRAPRIAPTERDTVLRNRHLRGVVHDENAWAMGGVAGHAGLFSSVRDLARFARMLLDGGTVAGGGRILDASTIDRFTTRYDTTSSRALGWDTPSERSSAGRHMTSRAFGHTGFTGTSIWVDPELDLFVVLLTNRVNPTRAERRHIPLRRAVHDAVVRAIVAAPR